MARSIAFSHGGFITERDIYLDDELADDPVYRDVLFPAGLGHAAAMVVTAPTGDVLIVSAERERTKGPVDAQAIARLDGLRPNLARAALMGARLGLERARAASEALGTIGLPALVFDTSGKVLAANGLLDSLPNAIRWGSRDRVSLIDARAGSGDRRSISSRMARSSRRFRLPSARSI